jgi:hypothetical protein
MRRLILNMDHSTIRWYAIVCHHGLQRRSAKPARVWNAGLGLLQPAIVDKDDTTT